MTIPAVAQVGRDGLDLSKGVTFLVGENGSGKSTLVEAVAMAYGLSPEGGSTGAAHSTRPSESPLSRAFRLQRGIGSGRWGFFLRAETMHGFYTYLEANPGRDDPVFHEMSHGESFLELLATRFDSPGFYCLDEPEAALSFSSTLGLVATLHGVASTGGRCSARRTPPSSLRCPARPSWRSATGACAKRRGRSSSWCSTGVATSRRRSDISGTCSTTEPPQHKGRESPLPSTLNL